MYSASARKATGAAVLALGVGMVSPTAAFSNMLTTFALSGVIGYQVVWGVVPALHSPLMAVTNAISGMTAVGGMYAMGGGVMPTDFAQSMAAVATGISAINITGEAPFEIDRDRSRSRLTPRQGTRRRTACL